MYYNTCIVFCLQDFDVVNSIEYWSIKTSYHNLAQRR